MKNEAIIVYTDGASKLPPPGPSGYAAIIKFPDGDIFAISGGEKRSTNGRSELQAVLKALEYLDSIGVGRVPIIVNTDAQYISKAINENWIESWFNRGWYKVKNVDIWLKVWKYICKLNVTVAWVKGHDGNVYNEMADYLAQQACYFQGIPFKLPVTEGLTKDIKLSNTKLQHVKIEEDDSIEPIKKVEQSNKGY